MKANRKFVQADEAVSPVIAVILMVAITVVLAATVFVLVSDIGSNTSKNAPQMGWSDDETNDKWSVSQAPNQVGWQAFQIRQSAGVGTIKVALNPAADYDAGTGPCTAANTPAGCVWQTVTTAYATLNFNGNIAGGDALGFCTSTAAGDANVQVTLLHTASNAQAKQFTFTLVAQHSC